MLVGRDREVAELEGAVAQLSSGTGALALISGEPGIGKSRLADEVVQRARKHGVRVAWGQCWEAGGAPAYWPWREACEGLGVAFPEPTPIASSDPSEARFALFRDVASALGGEAARSPFMIVLEDLHAADRSTLMLLEFVATQLRAVPILVLGTYRELEASLSPETAGSLGRASRAGRIIPLGRLGEAEVAQLVRDVIEDADERVTANVYETTLGNPLFVTEMTRDLRARPLRSAGIPLGVREIIRQRLALVSPEVRRVLEIAAAFGVEFETVDVARVETRAAALDDAGHVARADASAAATALDDAARTGLVLARGDRFRFAHALYREALYHDLPRARRFQLHREAARVLATRGCASSEIAHHLLESGSDAAADAIDHAIQAANHGLAVFAFEDAAALLERARAAIPGGALEKALRCRVMIARGELRIRSGDASGRALCVEAAQLARDLGDPALLARAGLAYGAVFMMGGVDPVLVAMLDEALAGLPAETALQARAMARLAAARQPSAPEHRPRDIKLAFEAVEVARRVAEPRELLEVLHAASGVMYGAVDPSIRVQISREQERLAEQLGDVTLLLHARTRLAIDHLEMADFAAHAQLATTYEQHAASVGPAAAPWRVPLMRSMQALTVDDFATSERLQEEARRLEHGQPRARRASAFHRICYLRAAERHTDLRAAIPELRGLWLEMPYGNVIGEPRVASALARIGAEDELRALVERLGPSVFHEEINGSALSEVVWLTGDPTYARILLGHTRLEPIDRWTVYWFDCEIAEAPSSRSAAYLTAILGEWEASERWFAQAMRAVEAAGRRAMAARMRFELGDLMLRLDREPARARALIAEGRAGAEAVGLAELVALIDRRHGKLDPAPAPSAAPAFAMALEGEYYAVTTAKRVLRFKSSRGMQYLARLLERPGTDVHVLELVGSSEHADRGDAGELLDGPAFRAYRSRLEALRDTLDDAEAVGDSERAERARTEMETIAAELSRATGKGGKARRAESAVDRARSAVQRRIKDALDRIAEQDGELGRWLRRAVRTGNFCSYRVDD